MLTKRQHSPARVPSTRDHAPSDLRMSDLRRDVTTLKPDKTFTVHREAEAYRMHARYIPPTCVFLLQCPSAPKHLSYLLLTVIFLVSCLLGESLLLPKQWASLAK